MKANLPKKPDIEIEQDQEDGDEGSDIEAGGPKIAAGKKSKMAVVAASSILITVVLYILFFKQEEVKKENLEEIVITKGAAPIAAGDGKSMFDLDARNSKSDENHELLDKPASPEVPILPQLPKDALPEDKFVLPTDQVVVNPPSSEGLLPNQPNVQNPALGVVLGSTLPAAPGASPGAASANLVPEIKKEIDPRYAPIIVLNGGSAADGGTSSSVGYNKNIVKLKEDPIDQLEKTKSTVVTTYIADRRHTIAQGKLLTAILETAINTEIPGFVRGIISRDVYGESGSDVLIPKGSRLFGTYSSKVARGQGRVEIAWTRLIRPDGVDLTISFNASDQFGRAGISGEVDNKYNATIANSLLTSILAVGATAAAQKLIGGTVDNTTTTNPTQGTTTTTGSATNQAIYDVSKTITGTVGKLIGDTIDVNPVIRVPQGTRVTVIVNADINIPSMSKK